MLASFHRSGGLATASRAGLRRSEAPERITRLYSEFDAPLRRASLRACAPARFAVRAIRSPDRRGAARAGLAATRISPCHQTSGAQ